MRRSGAEPAGSAGAGLGDGQAGGGGREGGRFGQVGVVQRAVFDNMCITNLLLGRSVHGHGLAPSLLCINSKRLMR